jgi:predicted transcriptional regulator
LAFGPPTDSIAIDSQGEDAMEQRPDLRRDVLVSVRPPYAAKIIQGQKTVELRRRFPESASPGATVFIYSSSPVSAVVGWALIKQVLRMPVSRIWKEYGPSACISKKEFDAYFDGLKYGFVIFLQKARALKQQLKAIDLKEKFGIVPPQSYRYLTEGYFNLLSDERFQTSNRYERRHRARRSSARSRLSG